MNAPELDQIPNPVASLGDAVDARTRRLARERTELIGWLARAVAHDVNNVLAVIAAHAEMIEADLGPDDPHIADTSGIRHAVVRAGALVRQLQTVGRRQTLRMESLDAVDIVDGLLPLLASVCGEEILVVVVRPPETAVLRGDRSLLEQALLNLAVNARDAMPDGGTLTITVSVGPQPSPGAAGSTGAAPEAMAAGAGAAPDGVRISVEDTGVGIETSILPHIFEPFFTTKSRDRGSGIGLTSVEEAAVRCGGTVSVQSQPGQGARFTLHLPRERQVAGRRGTGCRPPGSAGS